MDKLTRLIANGELSQVKNYLAENPGHINRHMSTRFTPIAWASFHLNEQLIDLLKTSGADPNLIIIQGYSSLYFAVNSIMD